MNYVPLRVYSVFSQGEGVVDPSSLGEIMQKAKFPYLPICDPMTLIGWEKTKKAADSRGLKPLLGTEIVLPEKGSLLLFPLSPAGYLSLVSCLNRRALPALRDVLAVFLPLRPDAAFLRRLQKKIGPENIYLGLEWQSGQWLRELGRECAAPLAWAQALRWTGDARKYAVARAVFQHLSLPETLKVDTALDGLIPAAAIMRRWGESGRLALANTMRLAERVAFDFAGLDELFPDGGNDLEVLVRQKLDQRRSGPAERERAMQELRVIGKTGAAAYFLIAATIADFCRRKRIFFNLRGSGVSSFVLFLMGMSRVNPLEQGLLFERFVNSLRRDLPDIDIDIDSSRRQEVFSWLIEHYRGRAAFVSSHKFFGARSALYETARAFGLNPDEAHALTKPLPMFAEPAELADKGKGALSRVYKAAALLDGVFRELSLHVGGVVFSNREIDRALPLTSSPEDFPQLVWDKDTVERLRIFKLDLLGVRGFEVIAPLALSLASGGRPLVGLGGDADGRDADVWQRIQQARTVGCFQLESPLSRENLLKARPASLAELAIAVAIIRPGPAKSGMKAAYLERRLPCHPLLGRLFPSSRGALIFEEQITVLLHHVSGWSLEQAEMARKEFKKKKGEALRDDFFGRGRKNGWGQGELELFWKLALDFSLYAFCQAHSLAYAYAAYLSAWLKTKQPLNFFCRLLNAGGGYYPLPVYVEEAKKSGLAVLAPDVNGSGLGFSAEQGAIRCGLMTVKGVGVKLAARIVESRGRGGYGSLDDFLLKTRLNERDLSALLAVSALQSLGRGGFSPAEQQANWQKYLGFQPSELSLPGKTEGKAEGRQREDREKKS
jgi:DNA polymerase III alpha subunit